MDSAEKNAVRIGSIVAGLILGQQAAVRVVRDTLFLCAYPATLLPVAMMAASLATLVSVALMSRVLARHAPSRVLPWVTGAAGVCLLLEWRLNAVAPGAAAVLLYLHFSVFGGVVISGFWSCVNERFDPLAAKNATASIGFGASIGTLLGGAAVWAATRVISIPALLPVLAAASLAVAAGIRLFAAHSNHLTRPPNHDQDESAVGILRRVSYLRILGLVVACGAISDALLDYVFKSSAAATIRNPAELASFFGLLNTVLALVGLGVQAGLSRRCLAKLGLAGTVATRPAGVLLASVAGLVHPRLWTAIGARACHDVTTPSLFRSGYEPLFIPLPEREKRPTKAIVDVAIDKLGNLVGGAFILAVLVLVPAPAAALYGAVIALCAVALFLTPKLQRGYVGTLEQSLRAGRVHIEEPDIVDEATRSTLMRVSLGLADGASGPPSAVADQTLDAIAHLLSDDPQRILHVITTWDSSSALVGHMIPLLERDELFNQLLLALRSARPTPVGQLVDALLDPGTRPIVRVRVARVLRGLPDPRTIEGLLLGLRDPRREVRAHCGRALAVVTRGHPALRPAAERVFAAVEGECGDHTGAPDLDHVFTLLLLALDREPLRLALHALRGGDRGDRGTALEYLENVLPPRLRASLWPHLMSAQQLRRRASQASSAAVPINRRALRVRLETDGRDA